MGGTRYRTKVLWSYRAFAMLLILHAGAGRSEAASCNLPASFAIDAEERGGMTPGAGTVVVTKHAAAGVAADERSAPALRAGDLIRQANGARVERCADLERVAAEAFTKGLRLLVLVERDGGTFALAAGAPAERTVARAARPAAPRGDETEKGASIAAADASSRDAGESARVKPPPRARTPAVLPPRHEVGPETIDAVGAALHALQPLDDAAALTMPVAVYERRLADAETTIAALPFGRTAAAAAVQTKVEEVLAFHRTARDIWQARLAFLRSRGVDRRGASGQPLPYFSDSQVPEWVGEYPFLQVTVLSVPRETRVLQAAGSWDAERAIELLWARAQESTAQLAAWLQS